MIFDQFRRDLDEDGVDLAAIMAGVPGALVPHAEEEAPEGDAGAGSGGAAADDAVGAAPGGGDEPGAVAYDELPKKNKQYRTDALAWLVTNPGVSYLIMSSNSQRTSEIKH